MLNERENLILLFQKYEKFLTQVQRQAFYLHYIEDLSLQEIAEIVATTRVAVFDSIKKSIKKLEAIAQKMKNNEG